MKLGECLEAHGSAKRPHWQGKAILAMPPILLAVYTGLGTDVKSNLDDFGADDFEDAGITLHDVRSWKLIGECRSDAEVARRERQYEDQAPMREKMLEFGRMLRGE